MSLRTKNTYGEITITDEAVANVAGLLRRGGQSSAQIFRRFGGPVQTQQLGQGREGGHERKSYLC